jgi:DNA-binding GntR family transcriptional regulator
MLMYWTLAPEEDLAAVDIANKAGVPENSVRVALRAMVEEGLLVQVATRETGLPGPAPKLFTASAELRALAAAPLAPHKDLQL